jgi:hypothetical protein
MTDNDQVVSKNDLDRTWDRRDRTMKDTEGRSEER